MEKEINPLEEDQIIAWILASPIERMEDETQEDYRVRRKLKNTWSKRMSKGYVEPLKKKLTFRIPE